MISNLINKSFKFNKKAVSPCPNHHYELIPLYTPQIPQTQPYLQSPHPELRPLPQTYNSLEFKESFKPPLT